MNHDDERDFAEERANEAHIRAEQDSEWEAERQRRRALYDSILADRALDRGVELDEDPDRYLLVERSTINGDAWPSTFSSVDEALRYHDEQEYPQDWDILALFDLDTEDGREIFTRTRTAVDLSEDEAPTPEQVVEAEAIVFGALGGLDGVLVTFGDGADNDTWEALFGHLRRAEYVLQLTWRDGTTTDAIVQDWDDRTDSDIDGARVLYETWSEDRAGVRTVPTDVVEARPLADLVGVKVW